MAQEQQRKLPGNTDRFTNVFKGGAQDAIKADAAKAAAPAVGNGAHNQRLAESDLRRDQMLQFIAQRLAQAKVLQARELDQIAKSRVWFDEVAKGKQGFKLPDPTRWRNVAQSYERAIETLCAGELGRGAQLLDRAIEAEKTVYHTIPAQVRREDWQQAPTGAPDARLGVDYDMAATPTDAGQEMLALAREISSVTTTVEDAAYPQRQKPHKGWWDKGEDGEDTKKEAPKAATATVAVAEIAKAPAPEAKAKEAEKPAPEKSAKAPAKAAPDKDAPEKEAEREPAVKAAAAKAPGAKEPKAAAGGPDKPKDAKEQAALARAKAEQQAERQEEDGQSKQAVREIAEKVTAGLGPKGGKTTPPPAKKK